MSFVRIFTFTRSLPTPFSLSPAPLSPHLFLVPFLFPPPRYPRPPLLRSAPLSCSPFGSPACFPFATLPVVHPQSIYSRCREPPIGHDDIDRILVQLFEDKDTTTGTSCRSALIADSIPRCTAAGRSPDCRGIPCHDDGAGGDRVQHKSSRHKRDDDAVPSTPGPSPSEAAGPQWRQVFPRKQARGDEQGATRLAEDFGTPTAASASTPAMSDGFSRELESSTNESEAHRAIDAGTPGRLCPNVGGTDPEDYVRSLWTWARRGGTPVGRLLSLLSIRIADCGELFVLQSLVDSLVGYHPQRRSL